MSATDAAVQEVGLRPTTERIVNDFAIQVATVNGSGSQTANLVLLRSIFQMGVPVSGKNMFPSNIAGLPTWYTIRASAKGYIGRKKEVDFLVAMNPETAREDVLTLAPGAAVVYDEPLKLKELRSDLVFYPVPFDKLMQPITHDAKLRRLVRNMVYDGVLSRLLSIDMGQMEKALRKQLGKKQKAIELNMSALKAGYDYAEANLHQAGPIRRRADEQDTGHDPHRGQCRCGHRLHDGGSHRRRLVPDHALVIAAGSADRLLEEVPPRSGDGKTTYAVVQAEDELAALGMVIGAGWAGARAMTSTAGPGVSLMAEFTGLGYYAEVPAVIFDVQRAGPSTGLPTRTGQQDILSTAVLSHGDTNHPLLLPASVTECYTMAIEAFDLAEQLQQPVFVMSDLDLGMNTWMAQPFDYPTTPFKRGKRLDAETLKKIGQFGRYRDVDGDGIPYRTVPGDGLPSYFARGSGHNEQALYSERADDYVKNLDRLSRKFQTAKTMMPKPEVDMAAEGGIGIIAYGTTHWAIVESRDQLNAEKGLQTSYLRLRAYPFSDELNDFIDRHDRVYVVEQNRDAQMLSLLRIDLTPQRVLKLKSIRHYAGLPIDGRSVTTELLKQEGI